MLVCRADCTGVLNLNEEKYLGLSMRDCSTEKLVQQVQEALLINQACKNAKIPVK